MQSRHDSHWAAPVAAHPVRAAVTLPGSKSMTNRGLILASLTPGGALLRRPLRSRDSLLMADALRSLGVRVEDDAGEDWQVRPSGLSGGVAVDVGNAGTIMRFLPPVAALADGPVTLDGDPRARQRPVAPLLDGLRALGVSITAPPRADTTGGSSSAQHAPSALPVVVHGRGRVTGGRVRLDASESSQLVSGLLLAAPRYDNGIELVHDGPPVPSAPHIAMTVAMLRDSGAEVDTSERHVWRVAPGPLTSRTIEIEPDLSNAAPFLAAALVTGGEVRIAGWPPDTTQPGDALRSLLADMGAASTHNENGLTVRGSSGPHGIDADLRDVSELVPTLAAIAALADSPSRLRGVAHMRRHETDRLSALASELGGLGAEVTEFEDGLEIHPRPLHGGVFHSYEDHRLATAGALIGLAVPGVRVENVRTTAKTLPGFTELWARLVTGGAEVAG